MFQITIRWPKSAEITACNWEEKQHPFRSPYSPLFKVNLLLPRFSAEEQREARLVVNENEPPPRARQLLTEIATYNRRHSGAPVPWLEQLRDLPVLLPYIISRLFSADGLNLMYRARIFIVLLFGVIYMIMPVDIIPEAFFGFLGILDDLAIFLMVAVYAVMVYRQYAAQQEP